MNTGNKKETALRCLALAAVSAAFLLFYASSTSPLTNYYGGDSAFFILVGQGMTEGMLPYRDFFDMKGPYLFLIEYLGQLICYGRTGAFVMQWVNLFISLWIMSSIYRMMLGNVRKSFLWELVLMAPCLYVAAFTLEGGNLTEEFSLPWLLLAVYFALRYFRESGASGIWDHPWQIGFYYGVAFGVLALIRVTNAAIIGAIIFTIAVGLLVKKRFGNLFLNGGMFILGCAAAFAPMCVFFACHGLLGEMLSQVFLFGVQYSAELSMAQKVAKFASGMLRCVLWAALPLAVLAVFRVKNWRYWLFSIGAFGLLLVATIMGNAYLHYFILGIPNVVLGLALMAEQMVCVDRAGAKRKIAENAAVLLVAAMIFTLQWPYFRSRTNTCANQIKAAKTGPAVASDITDIKSHIPESDYNRVYVYGLASCSNWYAQAGLLPAHHYCDWQRHYIELNPEIGDELESWLSGETPKWVVVSAGGTIEPAQIADSIAAHYREYAHNGSYILYCARGEMEVQK